MQGKIALEEHFAIDDTLMDSKGFFPDDVWVEVRERVLDIHGRRVRLMDEFGIEMMILSLNAPAIQAIPDAKKANDIARKANDYLAEQCASGPIASRRSPRCRCRIPISRPRSCSAASRISAWSARSPTASRRSATPTPSPIYDQKQYWPFWAVQEQLDVPFYLHPRNPLPQHAKIYEGHGWLLGPTWAFGQETAVHALRLMGSGLFDQYPKLQIILGHMGENLPFGMWRVDNTNGWIPNRHNYPAKKKIGHYFQNNFHITTSGNFSTPALLSTMMVVGSDRIMFSTDWPFENIDHAAKWFDVATISESDRQKIGRTNALRLFKLKS